MVSRFKLWKSINRYVRKPIEKQHSAIHSRVKTIANIILAAVSIFAIYGRYAQPILHQSDINSNSNTKATTTQSAAKDSVKLSTIHRAKGLENDRVFILEYEELPRQHLEQKEREKTQKVNLKYVAVTRAKKELFLVSADKVEMLKKKSLFDVLRFE